MQNSSQFALCSAQRAVCDAAPMPAPRLRDTLARGMQESVNRREQARVLEVDFRRADFGNGRSGVAPYAGGDLDLSKLTA